MDTIDFAVGLCPLVMLTSLLNDDVTFFKQQKSTLVSLEIATRRPGDKFRHVANDPR